MLEPIKIIDVPGASSTQSASHAERCAVIFEALSHMEAVLSQFDSLSLHAAAAHLSMAIESARKTIDPDRT